MRIKYNSHEYIYIYIYIYIYMIYICTITQHTYIIFSQTCHIRIYKYFIYWKTHCMKQHTILCSSYLPQNIKGTTMTSLVISH